MTASVWNELSEAFPSRDKQALRLEANIAHFRMSKENGNRMAAIRGGGKSMRKDVMLTRNVVEYGVCLT